MKQAKSTVDAGSVTPFGELDKRRKQKGFVDACLNSLQKAEDWVDADILSADATREEGGGKKECHAFIELTLFLETYQPIDFARAEDAIAKELKRALGNEVACATSPVIAENKETGEQILNLQVSVDGMNAAEVESRLGSHVREVEGARSTTNNVTQL